jgi:hypothetical protein
VLVEIENETHGERRRAQICSLAYCPNAFHRNYCVFKQSALLLVLFSSFRFMTARIYMSVSKSGRNYFRQHGLCEAWWAADIHFGKGVEFYSVCHFIHIYPKI